jgi:prephenate dehydratase
MDKKNLIAVMGSAGSFHDRAGDLFFGKRIRDKIYVDGFPKLIAAIEQEQAECGLVAIENTISGSLINNINLLKNSGLSISGETFLKIDQNLIAFRGQKIVQIQRVKSHPVALEQCSDFLAKFPKFDLLPGGDTASCAKEISENRLLNMATIGSKAIADKYGLEIIAENIQSQSFNFTRFLLIEKNPEVSDFDKASIVFAAPHEKGSLAMILSVLAYYGINLSKIQSAPLYNNSWEYFFYADLIPESNNKYRKALLALKQICIDLKVLGEYKQSKN